MSRVIDVIEWRPDDPNALVGRVPENGEGDIRFGSQLIVRETQAAVFFRDGKALDVFGPGRHTLSTANAPMLTDFLARFTGGKNVFQAEVYFVNQQVKTDMKWGTPNPIDLQDPDLGWVQLRAFGTMSIRIEDPQLFISTLVGAQGLYDTSALNNFLKGSVRMRFNDLVATTFKSYAMIRSKLEELAAAMKVKVKDDFGKYGIGLRDFFIQDVSVPEDIQQAFREHAQMKLRGVNYMQMQAADSMRDMANNQSGGASGMQMGASLGMGMMLPQMMQQSMMQQPMMQQQQQPMQQAAPAAAAAAMIKCQCGNMVPEGTKFCGNCGAKIMPAGTVPCPKCQSPVQAGAKFCGNCGQSMLPPKVTCPNCKAELDEGTKFCGNCGTKLG